MVSGLELIASAGLWGMSFALLWQAGYGHSRPTCNREAQQGSVKLNFLRGLRLLTSTEGSVNLHHRRLSIWFCNTKKYVGGGKEEKVAYHLHSSSAVLNLIKLNDWIISSIFTSVVVCTGYSQAPASHSIVRGITVILCLCTNRFGRLDPTQPNRQTLTVTIGYYSALVAQSRRGLLLRNSVWCRIKVTVAVERLFFFLPVCTSRLLLCWSQPKATIGAACSLGRDHSELQYVSRCPPTLSDNCMLKIPFPSSKAWTLHPICMLNASAAVGSQNYSLRLPSIFWTYHFFFFFFSFPWMDAKQEARSDLTPSALKLQAVSWT